MTVSELHADPALMAAFMGWPFEDDEVVEYGQGGNYPHYYRTTTNRKRAATEVTAERYEDFRKAQLEDVRDTDKQKWNSFIRECAREALGITGRSVGEVRAKCIAARPDLFTPPLVKDQPAVQFAAIPDALVRQPETPPAPERL